MAVNALHFQLSGTLPCLSYVTRKLSIAALPKSPPKRIFISSSDSIYSRGKSVREIVNYCLYNRRRR